MMSKKQWFVLLCIFVIYLMLGACIFWVIESRKERDQVLEDIEERREIEILLKKHYVGYLNETQADIFERLTSYCGKTLSPNMSSVEVTMKWDYYHSLFFVVTVVSTIGYGNLAPTTTFTRLFMILYGLIGIPMNGIVMVTLGEFFARSFVKLYHRWKATRVKYELATAGLVGQICLYLIPGVMFFMILPSIIFMWYEGWTYDVAIYYSFVTLTTIGFGDYVAGTTENNNGIFLYTCYQIFLFFWVIIGLGYIVMILGFITSALRHKKIHEIEHKIAMNIKKTPQKIREELRTILNEFLVMRVKRVYREKFPYVYSGISRSQSCPDLNIYRKTSPMLRKRAFSECLQPQITAELARTWSDTDLHLIDKDRTFKTGNAILEPSKLILKVVNALGNSETSHIDSNLSQYGVDLFSDKEILASEKYGSSWSVGENRTYQPKPRKRAISEVKFPFQKNINGSDNDLTWHGAPLKPPFKHRSLEQISEQVGFINKVKNMFKTSRDESRMKEMDIEKQDKPYEGRRFSIFTDNNSKTYTKNRKHSTSLFHTDQLLEETSVADFIRALASISLDDDEEESPAPKRKYGTASLTPPFVETPPRVRHLPIIPKIDSRRSSMTSQLIFNNTRRSSLMTTNQSHLTQQRRMSLRPLGFVKYDNALLNARRVSLKPEVIEDFGSTSSITNRQNEGTNLSRTTDRMGRFFVTKRDSFVKFENSPVERQVARRLDKDNSSTSETNKQ